LKKFLSAIIAGAMIFALSAAVPAGAEEETIEVIDISAYEIDGEEFYRVTYVFSGGWRDGTFDYGVAYGDTIMFLAEGPGALTAFNLDMDLYSVSSDGANIEFYFKFPYGLYSPWGSAGPWFGGSGDIEKPFFAVEDDWVYYVNREYELFEFGYVFYDSVRKWNPIKSEGEFAHDTEIGKKWIAEIIEFIDLNRALNEEENIIITIFLGFDENGKSIWYTGEGDVASEQIESVSEGGDNAVIPVEPVEIISESVGSQSGSSGVSNTGGAGSTAEPDRNVKAGVTASSGLIIMAILAGGTAVITRKKRG
ncbi:MAG: hypothetical protein FWE60_01550, partial [Oscillospiraceae bacterium]|nr:hypothetical protein [Oscillospiraceae bacterium]